MTDIRIAQQGSPFEAVTLDLLLTPLGDFDTTNELATAVTIALLTDGLALPDDTLPDPNSADRRGWWADTEAAAIWDGWPIGSKLWLLAREKITGREARQGALAPRVEAYIREALEPFLQRKIASDLRVTVTRVGNERIDAFIILYRGNKAAVELRYEDLWARIIASAPTGS